MHFIDVKREVLFPASDISSVARNSPRRQLVICRLLVSRSFKGPLITQIKNYKLNGRKNLTTRHKMPTDCLSGRVGN